MDLRNKPECDHEDQERSEVYDSYYCVQCLEWLESKCGDPNCDFCKNRPEKFAR